MFTFYIIFFSGLSSKTSRQSSCISSKARTSVFLLTKYVVVTRREFWEISWQKAIRLPAAFYFKGKAIFSTVTALTFVLLIDVIASSEPIWQSGVSSELDFNEN